MRKESRNVVERAAIYAFKEGEHRGPDSNAFTATTKTTLTKSTEQRAWLTPTINLAPMSIRSMQTENELTFSIELIYAGKIQ